MSTARLYAMPGPLRTRQRLISASGCRKVINLELYRGRNRGDSRLRPVLGLRARGPKLKRLLEATFALVFARSRHPMKIASFKVTVRIDAH
jgi:hypothetical protein